MSDELKPCPFCGADAKWAGGRSSAIICSYCLGTMVGNRDSLKSWNRRAVTPEMTAIKNALKRMEAKCGQLHRNPCDEMSRCHGEGVAIAVGILRDCLDQQGIEIDG